MLYKLFVFNGALNCDASVKILEDLVSSLEQILPCSIERRTLKEDSNTAHDGVVCFILRVEETATKVKEVVEQLSSQLNFDYLLVDYERPLTFPKLIVFDMDSTLIPFEVIDELAEVAGVKDEVSAVTEAAMQGKLDFNESLIQRVKTLKGLSHDAIETVKQRLYFNQGIVELCECIVDSGGNVAIASGGFVPFAQHLQQTVPFRFIAANELGFDSDGLNGTVNGEIVNAQVKARMLQQWTQSLDLQPHEVVAIGDGANDLEMMRVAGFGVAYKAKNTVNQQADCVLRAGDADSLVTLFRALF